MRVLFVPYVTNAFFGKLFGGLEDHVSAISGDVELFWKKPFPFDIVHIHFPEAFYSWRKYQIDPDPAISAEKFAMRLSELHEMGVKIIWTVHNLGGHNTLHPEIDTLVFGAMAEFANGIICQSASAKELFLRAYPKALRADITTIPHMNYIDCYPNRVSRQAARNHLRLPEDCFVFLCFGKIRPYKNINAIIRAFKKVSRIHKKSVLLIVGTPALSMKKRDLRFFAFTSFINRKIRYLPEYIEDNDLQFYLNAADICLFAFTSVFMSGSVILAGSFGIPVIAPDIGCLPDYVNVETGFLFRSDDMSSLVEEMVNATKCDLEEMGKVARESLIENSCNSIAERTYLFYVSQLRSPSPE